MGNLIDEAKSYEPKKVRNITDLDIIPIDIDVKDDTEAEYPYKYIEIKGEKYKIPNIVLAQLKTILKEIPHLKKFKVAKSGEGKNTQYQTIPILTP